MASREETARAAWRSMSQLFVSGETHDGFHAATEAIGLPHPGSLKALIALDAAAAPSMREMADGMRCDASYITALVDALEDLGYVERRVSPTDRRVKLVQLTEAGAEAKETALAVMLTPPKGFDALSTAELRTLASLMAKVAATYPPLA